MRQKIDIAEVEAATKIRAKYLRALENDEFGLLPGNTFVKTFLRTYAEYLGLDSQLLVEEYRVDYEPRGENELQPMVSRPERRAERRRPRPSRGPPDRHDGKARRDLRLRGLEGAPGADHRGRSAACARGARRAGRRAESVTPGRRAALRPAPRAQAGARTTFSRGPPE